MSGDPSDLDRRLLALVLEQPGRVLFLAIATGLAVAQEMVRRGATTELTRLGDSEALCNQACNVVLVQWAHAARAGALTEAEFQRVVRDVIRIARSS